MHRTKIEWTDFTVNFWEGCQKVGPACDNCYAEARNLRFAGGANWGPKAPRRRVKGGLAKLRKINRGGAAFEAQYGHFPRVFCSSLSDVFDNAVDPAWRSAAFEAIEAATDTRVQMLTKRVGNVRRFVPDHWRWGRWPSHVGLMITVVNQSEAARDIPDLLALKARLGIPWVGLSIEPMLGPVDLTRLRISEDIDGYLDALKGEKWMPGAGSVNSVTLKTRSLDQVIVGGETGSNARPMHPDWARVLRDQCGAAGVAYFFKQWGEWLPATHAGFLGEAVEGRRFGCFNDAGGWVASPDQEWAMSRELMFRIGKKAARRLLDGREWNQMPGGAA